MNTHTDITIILDRSGSMVPIKGATIDGFNSFVKEHQALGINTRITLVQFDDEYELVYQNKDIDKTEPLNYTTYCPRGTTALLDAIGTTINFNKKRFKQMHVSERPKNIVVAIITDGKENASERFTRREVFDEIKCRKQEDQWTFVFLAANQDAIHEGGRFGISDDLCLTIKHSEFGIKHGFDSFSKLSKRISTEGRFIPKFSKQDRDNQDN